MDARFDALLPRAHAAPAPAPVPRPAEPPWAQAWAHEWQQATAGQGQPHAGVDVRVAWRDASASSTWLAPVRPREDAAAAEDRLAPPQDAPVPEATLQAGQQTAAQDHGLADTGIPVPGIMAAGPQALAGPLSAPLNAPADPAPGFAAAGDDAGLNPPVATSHAGPGTSAASGAALQTVVRAPTATARTATTPRSAPPARTGESQPFAPTNLQVTAGDDGPAVWLRDARLAPDGHTTARLLQALATLGWPQSQRPGALYLNGRRLPDRADLSERLPAAPPAAREAARPDPIPSPKEDSHGH